MQIECILKRQGGTQVDIDGVEYDFQPGDDGAHVATVDKDEHIERFLAIPEGYRIHRADGKAAPTAKQGIKPAPAPAKTTSTPITPVQLPDGLMGSSVHQATYEIGGRTVQLGEVVAAAFEKSGLTVEEWNALEEEDRHAKIDIVFDDLAEAAEKVAAEASKKPAAKSGKK